MANKARNPGLFVLFLERILIDILPVVSQIVATKRIDRIHHGSRIDETLGNFLDKEVGHCGDWS